MRHDRVFVFQDLPFNHCLSETLRKKYLDEETHRSMTDEYKSGSGKGRNCFLNLIVLFSINV